VSDIAHGLHFLHNSKVVHGDIKPNNILVDDNGNALVADFGRSIVLEYGGYLTSHFAGCAEFMAPELHPIDDEVDIDDDGAEERSARLPKFTMETDVYAFAMVAFQVLTDYHPFSRGGKPPIKTQVPVRIRKGERPRRVEDKEKRVTDGLWDLLERSWKADPMLRPEMQSFCICPQLQAP
ncbi:kinase-like domain-containing protein, partial [Crucibulum laeve]